MSIQPGLQSSFGRGQLARHPRVPSAGRIHGPGKRLEQRLRDMVRFVPVKQLQMKVAPALIGKALEKLTGQAESERARHVLSFLSLTDAFVREGIQPPPD